MSQTDFASKLMPHLRGMASVCQFLNGPINSLRDALAEPVCDGSQCLIRLGFLYAPVCPRHYQITAEERELLRYALREYRNVSRRPRRLCGIDAASATGALLGLAQRTIQAAQEIARVQLVLRAKDQGLLSDWHKRNLEAAWPAIRDELASMGLPSKKLLEKYQVESDFEWGKVKRHWEEKATKKALPPTPTSVLTDKAPAADRPTKPTAEKVLTLDERALALFFADRNRTKKGIAEMLGVPTQSISPRRCPQLDTAMKAWRAANAGECRHGSKDRRGNVEAWEEDT